MDIKEATKLGSFIKRKREELELDQKEVASAMGIAVDTLGAIENGTIKRPPDTRLRGAARILKVSFNSLKSMAGKMKEEDGIMKEQILKIIEEHRPELLADVDDLEKLTEANLESMLGTIISDAKSKAALAVKAKEGNAEALTEQLRKEMKDALSEQAKTISELRDSKMELENRLDEKEVSEKLRSKEVLVDRCLEASSLPDEAKTDLFRGFLLHITEKKVKDKEDKETILTVEAQVKEQIADREKMCSGGDAKVTESGNGSSTSFNPDKLNEEEKDIFEKAIFRGVDGETAVMDMRKAKKEKEKEAGKAA